MCFNISLNSWFQIERNWTLFVGNAEFRVSKWHWMFIQNVIFHSCEVSLSVIYQEKTLIQIKLFRRVCCYLLLWKRECVVDNHCMPAEFWLRFRTEQECPDGFCDIAVRANRGSWDEARRCWNKELSVFTLVMKWSCSPLQPEMKTETNERNKMCILRDSRE